jgi:DNA-binding transcriptional regulator GbsR (MarR family)
MTDRHTSIPTIQDESFIEQFGAYGTRAGLPLSVARVFGYLLICEPHHQSAKSIRVALDLSAGSVSIATNMLVAMGIINKVTFPKDPSFYYTIEPHNFKKVIEQRVKAHAEAEALAVQALTSNANNPRLVAMRDVYGSAAKELQGLLEKIDLSKI